MSVYVTSDLHFNHDKDFIFKARGFSTVYEMNEAIIKNWNSVVNPDDDVYILGDLMLGDNIAGMKLIKQLKGKLHIVLGNHDTDVRKDLYCICYNIVEMAEAIKLKYNNYTFFMTHYPCITGNTEKESLKHSVLNLFGHTHQKDNFFLNNSPFTYHVGVDSHNCTPVLLDDIIAEMEKEFKKLK